MKVNKIELFFKFSLGTLLNYVMDYRPSSDPPPLYNGTVTNVHRVPDPLNLVLRVWSVKCLNNSSNGVVAYFQSFFSHLN